VIVIVIAGVRATIRLPPVDLTEVADTAGAGGWPTMRKRRSRLRRAEGGVIRLKEEEVRHDRR
jgi:hypothetical protein